MTPYKNSVVHDPANGLFGDCVRSAIASLLDTHPSSVPHFYADYEEGEEVWDKYIIPWLEENYGLAPFFVPVSGEWSLSDALGWMGEVNPDTYHMVFGQSPTPAKHVVIGYNGAIVHDPSWTNGGLVAPQNGYWTFCVFVPSSLKRKRN